MILATIIAVVLLLGGWVTRMFIAPDASFSRGWIGFTGDVLTLSLLWPFMLIFGVLVATWGDE